MIDLHLHTNHSDGTDSVEELLKKAEQNKLEIISITDHDSVSAYQELREDPKLLTNYSGKLITGVELKAVYQKINIEVLGYGFDDRVLKINQVDQYQLQQENLDYFKQVAKKLGIRYEEDIHICKEENDNQYASSTFARSILKYPENKEIFAKIGPEFEMTTFYRVHESNPKSIFYCDNSKYNPSLEEAIDDIHQAGGLAFLAHGYLYPFENPSKTMEEILKTTKLDGLECEYPMFSKEQREDAKRLCNAYHKYMSGGSDYHAKNKPNIQMGTGIDGNLEIPVSMVEKWVK